MLECPNVKDKLIVLDSVLKTIYIGISQACPNRVVGVVVL